MAPLAASLALLAFTAQALAAPTIVKVEDAVDDEFEYPDVVGCNGLMRKVL